MLSKFVKVTPEGNYIAEKVSHQVHYTTMNMTRAWMVGTAASRLAFASTIAARWSSVRR